MPNRGIVCSVSLFIALFCNCEIVGQQSSALAIMKGDRTDAPLENVVYMVQKALEQAEAIDAPCPKATGAKCFPPLTNIKLELSTTVGRSAGLSIDFLVVTAGHTKSKGVIIDSDHRAFVALSKVQAI